MTSFITPDPTPYFSPVYIPSLPSLGLSDDERELISRLQMRGWRQRVLMELADAYYRGEQIITNLGIAVPPELAQLRTIVGWPRKAVDPLAQRTVADSFRLADATDSDQYLTDIWVGNSMDAEQSLAFLDALIMGRSWITVGSAYEPGDPPAMCVESPLNMSVIWDARSRRPKYALQSYWQDDRRHAALWMPDQTIQLAEDDNRVWQIIDRDEHGFGRITIHRLSNSARSNQRDGASQITAEVMSITDAACRTLLGLEVAREVYSVPQKVLLGATEADFVDADGNPKTTWQTYITRVLGLERDEDGNLPEIHQFQAYDPSVFTKLIEMYASQMSGIIDSSPQDLGLYTQGNPVAAEAQQAVDSRRDRLSRFKGKQWTPSLVGAMQDAVRYDNKGVLPGEYERMTVDWMDPQILNFAGAADGIQKLVSIGSWVATSDVTLKKSGLTQVERARMEADRKVDAGASILAELAHSITAKEARVDTTIARDINPDAAKPVPSDSTVSGSGQ